MSTPKGVTTLTTNGADAYEHLKDTMGRFRTQSLFWENRNPKYPAPFTLKDKEHQGRLSMYEKYMEIGDPTEYRAAIALLGSWRHWEVLCSSDWFSPYVTRWRKELAVKIESDSVSYMREIEITQPGSPQALQATKWLADRHKGFKPKRGRPSKEEKAMYTKEASEEDQLLLEEAERLGLNND